MMKYIICDNNIVIVSLGVADIKFVYTPTLKQKSDYLIYVNIHIETLQQWSINIMTYIVYNTFG